MKIVAFLQLRNESENGNLVRCLDNCSKWSDEIFIYDDCSTDDSSEVYKKYTEDKNIIFGTGRNFINELFNKQKLLELTLSHDPTWIIWLDGDAILSRLITNHCKDIIIELDKRGFDSGSIHNMNLWRHPAFYRLDNKYNDLRYLSFWKNNGNLSYQNIKPGLHQQQAPSGMVNTAAFTDDHRNIHYGFASEENIVKKYLMYKSFGQKGWALDRLVNEISSFHLEKVPENLYPEENVPPDYGTTETPKPLTYNQYRNFNSWEEYVDKDKDKSIPITETPKPTKDGPIVVNSKPSVTIVGMIYKSIAYLNFMVENIKQYCLKSEEYDVNYTIVANDASPAVLQYLKEQNIPHTVYNDPKPDDYYINRAYRAWNHGINTASGDIAVIINSDMGLTPRWLETLLKCLNQNTIPVSLLVESGKLRSGQYAISKDFGRSPSEYKKQDFIEYASSIAKDEHKKGGLFCPCAFYKKDFISSGGYPEGNMCKGGIGAYKTDVLISGDKYLTYLNPVMSKKTHITVFNSIIYHIQEGEKDITADEYTPKITKSSSCNPDAPKKKVAVYCQVGRHVDMARFSIDSAIKNAGLDRDDYKLLFICWKTSDEVYHWLSANDYEYHDIGYDEGKGFLWNLYKGWNAGYEHGFKYADYVCPIATDHAFAPNWLANMMKHAKPNRIVTCRLIEPGTCRTLHTICNLGPTVEGQFNQKGFNEVCNALTIDHLVDDGRKYGHRLDAMPFVLARDVWDRFGPMSKVLIDNITGDTNFFNRCGAGGVEIAKALDAISYHCGGMEAKLNKAAGVYT